MGLMSDLKSLIMILLEGPYFCEWIVLSWMDRIWANARLVVVWFWNESFLSKWTPRNLPVGSMLIFVLFNLIWVTSELRYFRLNINSNVLPSLIAIRRFPQKMIILFMAFCRRFWAYVSDLHVVYTLISSANCDNSVCAFERGVDDVGMSDT